MEAWPGDPDLHQQVAIIINIAVGMNCTRDMQFGNIVFGRLYFFKDFINCQFPAGFAEMMGIGTELAFINTNIGRFNVEIPDKICVIAVFSLPDRIGQFPQEAQFSLLKKSKTFGR
jgi:hypothetical protein